MFCHAGPVVVKLGLRTQEGWGASPTCLPTTHHPGLSLAPWNPTVPALLLCGLALLVKSSLMTCCNPGDSGVMWLQIGPLCRCSWPSMQGGFPPHRRKLKLQLRASQMKASPGHTFWSDPVRLDALGGAAVVSVPSPLQGATTATGARAAYMFAVTATQVSLTFLCFAS